MCMAAWVVCTRRTTGCKQSVGATTGSIIIDTTHLFCRHLQRSGDRVTRLMQQADPPRDDHVEALCSKGTTERSVYAVHANTGLTGIAREADAPRSDMYANTIRIHCFVLLLFKGPHLRRRPACAPGHRSGATPSQFSWDKVRTFDLKSSNLSLLFERPHLHRRPACTPCRRF